MLRGMTHHEPGGRSPQTVRHIRPVPSAVEPAARGISQVTTLVPYLLGYHPDHSLVLLTLQPDASSGPTVLRGRVGFTARIDLPELEDLGELREAIGPALQRAMTSPGGAAGAGGRRPFAHAIAYDVPEEGDGVPSSTYLARLTEVLQELCDLADVELHDLVLVRPVDADRTGGDPAGDDPTGGDLDGPGAGSGMPVLEHRPVLRAGEQLDEAWEPLPAAADVPGAAELILRGRSPLRSRDELVARVRRRDETAIAATSLALDFLEFKPERLDEDLALSRLGSWVVDGDVVPSPRDRAWIAALLHDTTVRDAVLARWLPELFDLDEVLPPDEAASLLQHLPPWPEEETLAPVGRLLTLVAQVPPDLSAPLLTLAGLVAWAHGEGTVAQEACRYAREVDPAYRMARLLDQALTTGMRPPAGRHPGGAEVEGRRGVA